MLRRIRIGLIAVASLATLTCQMQAAIVVNGGFEDPIISPNGYVTVNAGQNTITGWSVGDTSVDIVSTAGNASWAYQGAQSIDLAGTPGPGSVFQNLSTTAGSLYDLVFYVSSNGGANSLVVSWDGSQIGGIISTPAGGTWIPVVFTGLLASSSSTEIRFASLASNNSNAGPLVDSVSVELSTVPEPASLIVWSVLGIAGVVAYRRRTAA